MGSYKSTQRKWAASYALLFACFVLLGVSFVTASAPAANLTTLVNFCGYDVCALGRFPAGRVILDPAGNLFGASGTGGTEGRAGTIFEIPKTSGGYAGTPTILYSFCPQSSCIDGGVPSGALTADTKGNLFGTTVGGGDTSQGTIFELAKSQTGYSFRRLYSFCAVRPSCTDGTGPRAGVIADRHGNLYGTTSIQSLPNSRNPPASFGGSVFILPKKMDGQYANGVLAFAFCSVIGCPPAGGPGRFGFDGVGVGLAADRFGDIFGTTNSLHPTNGGTVFEFPRRDLDLTKPPLILHTFCGNMTGCTEGNGPGPLMLDRDDNIFGTTAYGGNGAGAVRNGGLGSLGGIVFEIAKTRDGYGALTLLYSFCTQPGCVDGDQPSSGLIMDAAGNLFGETIVGGAAHGGGKGGSGGTVFEIAKTLHGYASTPTTLYSFCTEANCTDGAWPQGGLVADPDGNLFGVTQQGGANTTGTVFELTNAGFVSWFKGTPGTSRCRDNTIGQFTRWFGDLDAAARFIGYPGGGSLGEAIENHCRLFPSDPRSR